MYEFRWKIFFLFYRNLILFLFSHTRYRLAPTFASNLDPVQLERFDYRKKVFIPVHIHVSGTRAQRHAQDAISHQRIGPVTNEKQKKNGVTQADTRVDGNEPQWKAGMITTNELRKGERLYSTKILSPRPIQSA